MQIEFERSGGFTAIPLRLKLDTSSLEPGVQKTLESLVHQAKFFELPARLPTPGGGADHFQYKLSIQDNQRQNTVETGESSVPPDMQPLIQQLVMQARTSRPRA
jgi:hypothetical protein